MADKLINVNHDFGGSGKVTGLAAPTASSDAATKAYVDAYVEGVAWKDAVRVASTGNVNLASPGATIDGITMVAGDRMLLKNQTTTTENGIYIWNGAATPATRAPDGSTFEELEGAVVVVEEGTTNAGTSWRQTGVNGTIGSTAVTWTGFIAAGAPSSEASAGIIEIATQAETDTGTDDARAITPLKLKTASYLPKGYSTQVGDGSATSIVVTHNLNTRKVLVSVFLDSGTYDEIDCEKELTSVNSVTLKFNTAPTSNQYRVNVIGFA